MRKTLLVTDIPPCSNYTAGIALKTYFKFLDHTKFAIFTAVDRGLPDVDLDESLKHIPYKQIARPNEMAFRKLPRKLGTLTALIREFYIEYFVIPKMVREAEAFAKEHAIEALWCVLQGPTMLRIADRLSKALKVPLYTNVWDPPSWSFRALTTDFYTRSRMLKTFDSIVRGSRVCGTAGPDMAARYNNDYGVKTVALLPCLSLDHMRRPEAKLNTSDQFVITLAGQIYASEEWNALIKALDSVDWVIENRKVKIRVLGRGFHWGTAYPCRIEFVGWHSTDGILDLVSQSDIAYCPYWFSETYKTEASLSFPSKLTHYLAAGRPVFFHGPVYASPGRFLKKYQAGALCHSLDPREILVILRRMIVEPEYYSQLVENGFRAFRENLSDLILEERVHQFLEVGVQP